ncbi:MAG: hypothetical protein ABR563_12815 [Pyrinomonadaceae bacterium]
MKLVLTIALLATVSVAAGCDPDMTIRQTNMDSHTVGQPAVVNVNTTNPLIGETWYAPHATLTNSSDTLITVTKVELVADGATYENKPPGAAKYPLSIEAGKVVTLPVWFDLNDDVWSTFKKKVVELRVHCHSGSNDYVSSAFVVGGPHDTNAQ